MREVKGQKDLFPLTRKFYSEDGAGGTAHLPSRTTWSHFSQQTTEHKLFKMAATHTKDTSCRQEPMLQINLLRYFLFYVRAPCALDQSVMKRCFFLHVILACVTGACKNLYWARKNRKEREGRRHANATVIRQESGVSLPPPPSPS